MTEMCLSQAGYMLETALPGFMITLKKNKQTNKRVTADQIPFLPASILLQEALSSLGRKTQAQWRGAHAPCVLFALE